MADTTVYILQHGEKQSLPGDPGLTDRGWRQAVAAATRLEAHHPVAVVTSPFLRARQTVEPLVERSGLALVEDSRLAERLNCGRGDDPAAFFADWQRSVTERDWIPPRGRSSHQTAADMLAAIAEHATDHRTIVCASHGGATTDLLRELLGDSALEAGAPGLILDGVPGGAITTLKQFRHSWFVVGLPDDRHVPEADRTGHRA